MSCIKVAFTAGCTFPDVAEAQKAASGAMSEQSLDGCVGVTMTIGCTFGNLEDASKAAQPHLDAMANANDCGQVLTTVACTIG